MISVTKNHKSDQGVLVTRGKGSLQVREDPMLYPRRQGESGEVGNPREMKNLLDRANPWIPNSPTPSFSENYCGLLFSSE